ncbi:hypothetical protein BSKO_10671 [Bryopsis sp. KO-2023]|nr:hypothetical protein BSKO_10671 [Bryopsis sp. KO-2023]
MPVAPCEKDDTTAVLEWTYTDDRMVAYHGAAKGGVGYFLSTLARGPATLPSTSSTRGPRQTRQVYQGCKHPSGFRPTSRPSSARDIKDLGPKWRAISYYETEPRVINDHVQCLQKLETQREDENDCESPPPTDRRRPVHSASRNRAARELEQAMNDLDKFDERLELRNEVESFISAQTENHATSQIAPILLVTRVGPSGLGEDAN